MPGDVRMNIGAGVLDRITHASLRAEMNDTVELPAHQRTIERLVIGEIHCEEIEPAIRDPRDLGQTGVFETDVVIIVEDIDPDHAVPPRQQGAGNGGTDEPGGAGDEDGWTGHAPSLANRGRGDNGIARYCCSHGVRGLGAPVTYPSQMASFNPSDRTIKAWDQNIWGSTAAGAKRSSANLTTQPPAVQNATANRTAPPRSSGRATKLPGSRRQNRLVCRMPPSIATL